MWTQFERWFADESGQDLVEYALLTTAIGIAVVLGVEALGNAMNFAYSSWDEPADRQERTEATGVDHAAARVPLLGGLR